LDSIIQGIAEGLRLIFSGDPRTYEIALRSLEVSLSALAISLVLGIPIGALVGLSQFRGRRVVVATLNTGMGMPRVVVGLVVALFLWRTGPLGGLGLMYTIQAMVIAQTLIATPIIAALCVAALQQLDSGFRLQVMSLGAGRFRTFFLLLREIKGPLLAAMAAAFGGIIAEVGAVMMVGGNIKGQTEVLTTGIVSNVNMGLFGSAIALAVVLLILSFSTNLAMILLQRPRKRRDKQTRVTAGDIAQAELSGGE
jgi:tungstate transport system permease protein